MKKCGWKHYIRPTILVTSFVIFYILIFIDGKILNVKNSYIDVLQSILLTLVGFYFGGRTYEKVKGVENNEEGGM